MTFYSEPNVEIMPCQCCMQSDYFEKVPTHLMSDVYTLGFEPISQDDQSLSKQRVRHTP